MGLCHTVSPPPNFQTRRVPDLPAILFPWSNFYLIRQQFWIWFLFDSSTILQFKQGKSQMYMQCFPPRWSDSYLIAKPFFCRQNWMRHSLPRFLFNSLPLFPPTLEFQTSNLRSIRGALSRADLISVFPLFFRQGMSDVYTALFPWSDFYFVFLFSPLRFVLQIRHVTCICGFYTMSFPAMI